MQMNDWRKVKLNVIEQEPPREIKVEPFISYASFDEAYSGTLLRVKELNANGVAVYANRIWQDFFTKPRGNLAKVLGFSAKARRDCEKLAPGGKWIVKTDTHTNHPARCVSNYVDKITGRSFAHFEERRDERFKDLQKMRSDCFVFHRGRIWEL